MKAAFLLVVAGFVFSACDKQSSLENARARARAEGEASGDAAKDINNKNLAEKAQKMEAELRTKYRFFEALSGTFEGDLKIGAYELVGKLRIFPSIHIVETGRVRALEEIQQDLNSLHIKAQVHFVNPKNGMTAGACVFDSIRPDLKVGAIDLLSNSCPNVYMLSLIEGAGKLTPSEIKAMRESIAAKVLGGQITKIIKLHVAVQIANDPETRDFEIVRKEDVP